VAPLSPSSNPSSKLSHGSKDRRKLIGTYPNRYERSSSSRLRPPSPAVGSGTSQSGSTIFSGSSAASGSKKKSRLREEILRNSTPGAPGLRLDLFPFVKARLSEIPFRPPRYTEGPRTVDFLRQEMLRTVFGWDGPVVSLIRYERKLVSCSSRF
jgi:hypothetical protein